jgi:hypothetical protein
MKYENEIKAKAKTMDIYLTGWLDNVHFNMRKDYVDVVLDIRKNMLDDIYIPKVDMLTYKKAIVGQIQYEYENTREYNFSDKELLENRIQDLNEYKDMKITKLLSKQIQKNRRYPANDQRLDYFHKLPSENKEYFITGDPAILTRMYIDVDTCVSPDGENQAAFLQYLLSPYLYMIYSNDYKNRMLVILDKERKMITTSRVYGGYDFMMGLSFAKWCVDNGYSFVDRNYKIIDTDNLQYIDSSDESIARLIEYFNGDIIDEYVSPKLSVFNKPEHCTFQGDALTAHHIPIDLPISTMERIHSSHSSIMDSTTEYCDECGCHVGTDEYDSSEGVCYGCAENHNYCDNCDEYHHSSDYDFDIGLCNYCVETLNEEEEDEE